MTGLLVLLLGAIAGLLELRRRYAGLIVFAGIAAAGIAAKFVIVPSWFQTFLPAAVGPAAGYLVLHLLIGRLSRHLAVTADLTQAPSTQRATDRSAAAHRQPST